MAAVGSSSRVSCLFSRWTVFGRTTSPSSQSRSRRFPQQSQAPLRRSASSSRASSGTRRERSATPAIRAVRVALGDERLRVVGPDRLHVGEAEPHRTLVEAALDAAQVHVRRPHLHPSPLRIPHQTRRRVEAHRLRVQERAEELGRIVVAQPSGLVAEQAERGGMRLREAEAGERRQLVVDEVRGLRTRPRSAQRLR